MILTGMVKAALTPIVTILPQLPPTVCGVGDYTTRLLTEWNEPERFHFLLLNGVDETRALNPELAVTRIEAQKASLLAALRSHRDADVLLQYIPYGLDSRGCPLWVIDAVEEWHKNKPSGRRLVVMFHELWALLPWWRRQFWTQRQHKAGIKRLLEVTDTVFTNTEGYAQWIRDLMPGKEVLVAPVGTNIVPSADDEPVQREEGSWVLFGRQGTRIYALRQLGPELKALYEQGRLKKLTTMGGGNAALQAAEDEAVRACLPADAVNACGFVDEVEASRMLSRAELGVSCQTWSSVTKSTTFMAYAAHGLNILSPFAGSEPRAPFNWLTSAKELRENRPELPVLLDERSAQLREWHRQHASWPEIMAKFRGAFDQRALVN